MILSTWPSYMEENARKKSEQRNVMSPKTSFIIHLFEIIGRITLSKLYREQIQTIIFFFRCELSEFVVF